MDDLELVHAYARDGNPAALAELVRRHRKAVLATCLRKLGSMSDAEDATQDVFLALMNQAGEIHTSVGAWLHRCAQNVANAMLRSRRNRKRWEVERALLESPPADADQALAQERFTILEESLKQLDARDHELLLRNCVQGSNQQEIAASLGVSQQSVSKRLSRIVTRLRHGLRLRGVVGSVAVLLVLSTRKIATAAIPGRWASPFTGGAHQELAETSARVALGLKVAAASAMVYAATAGGPSTATGVAERAGDARPPVPLAAAEVLPAIPEIPDKTAQGDPALLAMPAVLTPITGIPLVPPPRAQPSRAIQETDSAPRSLVSEPAAVTRVAARPPERQGAAFVTNTRHTAPSAAAPAAFSAPARMLVLKAGTGPIETAPARHLGEARRDVPEDTHAGKSGGPALPPPAARQGSAQASQQKRIPESPAHPVPAPGPGERNHPPRTALTITPSFEPRVYSIQARAWVTAETAPATGLSFLPRVPRGERLSIDNLPWAKESLGTLDRKRLGAAPPPTVAAAADLFGALPSFKHMAPLGEAFAAGHPWLATEADDGAVLQSLPDQHVAFAGTRWTGAFAVDREADMPRAPFAAPFSAPEGFFTSEAAPLAVPEPMSLALLAPALLLLARGRRR